MKITASEQESFELAEICYICEEKLNNDRVRDHCHLTGNYRGAAHNECNLNYKVPKFYPVFIHNLSGYDAHLFVKNLSGKISCIPNTEEKYISFSELDILPDIENRFDTSNYPKIHTLPTGVNKKVIGMFKDEAGGKQITEFVGLRAKLYSYRMDKIEEKKCKGINKTTRDNRITFDDYKECLLTRRDQHRTMNVLRSHKHTMYAETINKVALSAEDDKRIIIEDGITTIPYGYNK